MRRVIVTGASGFVGAHVLSALTRRGYEVHAASRHPPHMAGVVPHEVDLFDLGSVSSLTAALRASHLLHLAWCTEPGAYRRSPTNLDWTAATLLLVRSFAEAGGERVVGAGTCAEYAWGAPRLVEDDPCSPTTLYGTVKDATRRILEVYAREFGLSFAWGRLFFLYGPGERPGRVIGDAVRALRAGKRFIASPGHQRRDFSHVADAGAAFAALVDTDVTGSVNIGSGSAIPVQNMLEIVGALSGRPDLIEFGGRTLMPDEPACIEADVSRLLNEVAFKPSFGISDGLRSLFE